MIEILNNVLPIVIYILLIILLVLGIILGIKSIRTLDKVDAIVDDVHGKIKSLNGLFSIIDFTTDKIVSFTDKIVDVVAMLGSKLFFGRKKKKEKEEE